MAVFGHPKFGATGRFPRGRLTKDDEGELRMGVTVVGSLIRIDFGKEVSWLGLGPDNARELAETLNSAADEAEKGGAA